MLQGVSKSDSDATVLTEYGNYFKICSLRKWVILENQIEIKSTIAISMTNSSFSAQNFHCYLVGVFNRFERYHLVPFFASKIIIESFFSIPQNAYFQKECIVEKKIEQK